MTSTTQDKFADQLHNNEQKQQIQTVLNEQVSITLKKWEEQLTKREQVLREKEKELDELKKEVKSVTTKLNKTTNICGKNQKIKLSIGGTLFVTTLNTLTEEKDTYFSALFSEYFQMQLDEDGEIFIDRDPTHFRIILNHLRGVEVNKAIALLNEGEKENLEQEIDFYQINSMFHWFPDKFRLNLKLMGVNILPKFDKEYSNSIVTVLGDGHRVKSICQDWKGCIAKDPCNYYCIRLIQNCNLLMIGIAPKINFINTSYGFEICGWYMNTYNGTKFSQNRDSGTNYCNEPCKKKGTIIEVRVEDGNCSYIVNGKNFGIAYTNLPNDDSLYPAFYIAGNGEFEFLSMIKYNEI
jgi:hypothetical protein